MKRNILFIAAGLIMLLSACKKEKKSYTCTCQGGFSGQGMTVAIEATSDSKADAQCATYNDDPNTADGYHNCHIQ